MKKFDIKKMIKEELKTSLREESQKRYVATMEFFVWAPNESEAKNEAEQVMKTVSDKYDNSANISDLTPQSFGSIGTPIRTNISEATKDEKLYELVGNLFELFGSMKHLADDFYEKLDADSSPLDILKSFTDKESRSIILRYFKLNRKLKNIPIEEIKPHIERWMAEHEDEAQEIYAGGIEYDRLKSMRNQKEGASKMFEGKLTEPYHTPDVLKRLGQAENLLDIAKNNLGNTPVKSNIEDFLEDRLPDIDWV